MSNKKFIPWVEKYRPEKMEDIVLDSTNKTILNSILEQNYFPNLLLYGPPGTGKTTTIINLINRYQQQYDQKRKDLKIHLNASDDRGIDIIRNKINQFVNTNTLFKTGTKFVILDEVDYMTKNAQQALRYLIQQYSNNIRFCLICNYICRIDAALQNEFLKLKFCHLPKNDIYNFINKIQKNEKINLTKKNIINIQNLFNSDIRSMINYLQSNSNKLKNKKNKKIIDDTLWEKIFKQFKKKNTSNFLIKKYIKTLSKEYNIQINKIIRYYIKYLIKTNKNVFNNKFFKVFTYIIHDDTTIIDVKLNYFVNKFLELHKLL